MWSERRDSLTRAFYLLCLAFAIFFAPMPQWRSPQWAMLYETAFTEKAFAAVAELQWFLTEQVEEEKTGREIVTKLKMIGNDPPSLLEMDRELGARTAAPAPPTTT